jgi:perosamine synthetase
VCLQRHDRPARHRHGLDLKGSEFITTPYTYGASLAGWLLLNNLPVFADIDPGTLTLDPDSIRWRITRRTKALLAVDIFGNPADAPAIRKLADEAGLWYVADAAQSFGAFRDGRPASSLADAFVVSFTTGKPIFAGEGGAVLTDNRDLYEKLIWYSQHPYRQRRDISLQFDNEFGINGRIHPLAAIWANATFDESLDSVIRRRIECFGMIDVLNSTGLTEEIDFKERRIEPAFFRLSAAWKKKPQVAALLRELQQSGIYASLEDPPVRLIYQQPAFLAQYRRSGAAGRCPVAERQARLRFCVTGGE